MARPSAACILLAVLLAPMAARASVITVGVGQTYTTIAAGVAAAAAGDTIDVLAGTYVDQTADITVPLTIQGVGGPVIFTQTPGTEEPGLKGFLVIDANTTVTGITFENAAISDANGGDGAGIRQQQGSLTVSNDSFIGNQNGILSTPDVYGTGSLTVSNSTFTDNGSTSAQWGGYEHAIYATHIAILTVQNSIFQGTILGHDIKSRAATSIITGNFLDDGVTGTTSYATDFSNGGVASFTGNTIDQGLNSQNWSMLAYGAEGLVYSNNSLLVQGNIFNNSLPGAIGVNNFTSSVTASVTSNTFNCVANPTAGPATLSNNVINLPGSAACAVPEPAGVAPVLTGLGFAFAGTFLRRPRAGAGQRRRGLLRNQISMPQG